MFRILLQLSILALVSILLVNGQQVCVKSTVSSLNFRNQPNTYSTVLFGARPGNSFQVLGRTGDWIRARATFSSQCGREGYIHGDYVVSCGGSSCGSTPNPPPSPPPSGSSNYCTTTRLNIRNGASTTSGIVYTAESGDKFAAVGRRSGSFVEVRATSGSRCGTTGWAHSDYLRACAASTCSSNPPSPPPSGSGWLSSAGSFTVERLDRTGRRGAISHSYPVNKFLLHTIEGRWPNNGDWEAGINVLDGSRYWPHFIVAFDNSGRLRIGQFLPVTTGGFALRDGNRDGVIQVEIGAKADMPFTDTSLNPRHGQLTGAVKALFQALQRVTDIPNRVDSRIRFAGNGAYGTGAPQRVSQSVFRQVSGLVGHQHVYSNSHWDPGMINPNALL